MDEAASVLAMWLLTVALLVAGSLTRLPVTVPAPLARTVRLVAPGGALAALVLSVALQVSL